MPKPNDNNERHQELIEYRQGVMALIMPKDPSIGITDRPMFSLLFDEEYYELLFWPHQLISFEKINDNLVIADVVMDMPFGYPIFYRHYNGRYRFIVATQDEIQKNRGDLPIKTDDRFQTKILIVRSKNIAIDKTSKLLQRLRIPCVKYRVPVKPVTAPGFIPDDYSDDRIENFLHHFNLSISEAYDNFMKTKVAKAIAWATSCIMGRSYSEAACTLTKMAFSGSII